MLLKTKGYLNFNSVLKSVSFWYILSLLLNLGYLLLVFSKLGDPSVARYYFNSDMLFDPVLFQDIFTDKTGFEGWHINSTLNFFPDMPIYFFYMAIFRSNFIYANFAFSITQYILILLLFNLLLRQINKENYLKYATTFNLLFLLFLLIPLLSDRFHLTFQILSISYHIGSYVMFLICLNLLINYCRKQNYFILALLFITSTLGVFNDRLFISQYIFSILPLSLLMFNKNHFKILYRPVFISIISLGIGIFLFKLLEYSDFIQIPDAGNKILNLDNIGSSWRTFLEFIWIDIIKHFPELLILLIAIFSMVRAWIFIVKNTATIYIGNALQIKTVNLYLLIVIAVYIPVTAIVPIISGAFNDPSCVRYNIMSLIVGLFLSVFIIQFLPKSNIHFLEYFNVYIPILSIVFVSFLTVQLFKPEFKKGMKEFFNYYPEIAQVLDKLKDEHDLKYGIGNYWHSKYPTMLSRNDVRVYSVFESTLRPYIHGNNENWYYSGGKGKYKNPLYNFIVRRSSTNSEILKTIFNQDLDTIFIDPDNNYFIIKTPEFEFDRSTNDIIISESFD